MNQNEGKAYPHTNPLCNDNSCLERDMVEEISGIYKAETVKQGDKLQAYYIKNEGYDIDLLNEIGYPNGKEIRDGK